MIKFDKNIKFGGQGCPPYGAIDEAKNIVEKINELTK